MPNTTISISDDARERVRELAQAMGITAKTGIFVTQGSVSGLLKRLAELVEQHTAATVAARLEPHAGAEEG